MPITPTLEPKVIGTVVTTLGRGWLVTDLFANGENGTFSDIHTYATSYFSDAGTTPAVISDPIYQINDQSGNGANWTQATATARPILAREPITGRRNLLTWTEDFSNAAWSKYNVTVSEDTLTDTSSAGSLMRVYRPSVAENAAEPHTATVVFYPGTRSVVFLEMGDGGISSRRIKYDMATEEFLYVGSGLLGATATVLPDGGHQISITGVPVSDTGIGKGVAFGFAPNSTDLSITTGGDGTGTIRARIPQFEVSSTATPYQKVTTQYDVTEEGVPSIQYLSFDLGDDVLNCTLAAGTYTVVLPTREGIFFDEVAHTGGTFSIGPTSYTGGPAGIMEALATSGECRMIGPPLAIDRAFSAGESNGLVRWDQARGAGPEYTP